MQLRIAFGGLGSPRKCTVLRLAEHVGNGRLIAEYVEIETGKTDDRPKLRKALHRAKVTGATLVITKLDRLSRNLRFIAELQESRVKFVCADMPDANDHDPHLCIASSA
jgi:DNA invertase Pin-like site-specific DNA recombinase